MDLLCRKSVALLLLLTFLVSTAFAQSERAILYPGHDVTLNGASLQTSSAVSSGDKIHTGSSEAQMTGRGLLALIEPDSTLQYGDVMLLQCGGVLVSSIAKGVQASDTRVTPIEGSAKFRMVNRGGKLTVEVQAGAVRVSSDETVTLSAGQSVERPSSDGCPVVAAGTPAAAGAGSRGKIAALIIAGGGAGAAGLIIAEREKKPVSPAHR